MAQAMNRSVSAQETHIHQEEPDDDKKCPICFHWFKDPLLTKCGHRFCKQCITSWLKKGENRCPLDNNELLERELVPDLCTQGEMMKINIPCKNSNLGCSVLSSPIEMEKHLIGCQFQATSIQNGLSQCQRSDNTFREMDSKMWDAPNKNGTESTRSHTDLIRLMYERIVTLEQQTRESKAKMDNLTLQLTQTTSFLSGMQAKFSDGVLVWQINQFPSKVHAMSSNPNIMFYSAAAFTSFYGYKFCARINISPKARDFLGLHIHMMQSENDFHLDWPFKGRIKILMVHPRDLLESQSDHVMTKPEILAFHRPHQEVSPRGFGFVEYACISDIIGRGFVSKDTLTIKIQMNIV